MEKKVVAASTEFVELIENTRLKPFSYLDAQNLADVALLVARINGVDSVLQYLKENPKEEIHSRHHIFGPETLKIKSLDNQVAEWGDVDFEDRISGLMVLLRKQKYYCGGVDPWIAELKTVPVGRKVRISYR